MGKYRLDYDKKGIEIRIEKGRVAKVFKMKAPPPVKGPGSKIKAALRNPVKKACLEKLLKPGYKVCIVVSDKTRPVPNKVILPPVLEELKKCGIKRENITILIATGLHSPTEGKDLLELLGAGIVKNYRVVNHNARDKRALKFLGRIDGNIPVYVNKIYVESDFKIVTGFIEPHFMAGFSGGRKGICPGISGIDTVKYFHSPKVLESKYADPGVLKNNPCHRISSLVAVKAGIDFLLNVTLNSKKQITGIFAGAPLCAFLKGVKFCEKNASDHFKYPLDAVITSGGGYPLDRNYYQTVKGIVSASKAVKKNGLIIIASACSDGIGSPEFRKLLKGMSTKEAFMKMITRKGYFCIDQWEVEELVKGLNRASIVLYTTGLSGEDLEITHVRRTADISGFVRGLAKCMTIGIIPNGPYTLAGIRK